MSNTLWIKSNKDDSVHEVQKYVKDYEGRISIWSNTWYGHHVIGQDCEFTQEALLTAYQSAVEALQKIVTVSERPEVKLYLNDDDLNTALGQARIVLEQAKQYLP